MTPVPQHRGAIPGTAWAIAIAAAILIFLGLSLALFFPDSNAPLWARFMVPLPLAAIAGGYILLIGYIYGDARRRGMRYVLWTLLAALAPSGIGIILYFILREAMPVHCTQCGFAMRPGYAFCPGCGAAMSATCLQCHRVAQPGWSHCGWCGAKL
jgi:hypothetical protein